MSVFSIDIGGTQIKSAVVEEGLTFKICQTINTEKTDLEALLNSIENLWKENGKDCEGIAICLPGIIDSEKGICINDGGTINCLNNQPLASLLSERIDVKVHLENDGKAAAIAELKNGALKDCKNGAVYIIGTGIGGGIIVDGKVVRGYRNSAGEFSHMNIDYTKADDKDNAYGSMWKYCAVSALLNLFEKKSGIKVSDGKAFFEYYSSGNKEATEALKEYCRNIAVQLLNLGIMLNCEKIAIGGGISKQPVLTEEINRHMDDLGLARALKDEGLYTFMRPQIVPCAYGSEANLIGAALSYWED